MCEMDRTEQQYEGGVFQDTSTGADSLSNNKSPLRTVGKVELWDKCR